MLLLLRAVGKKTFVEKYTNLRFSISTMAGLSDSKRFLLIRWLHHVPQDDGLLPEILFLHYSEKYLERDEFTGISNIKYDANKLPYV